MTIQFILKKISSELHHPKKDPDFVYNVPVRRFKDADFQIV